MLYRPNALHAPVAFGGQACAHLARAMGFVGGSEDPKIPGEDGA